MNNTAELFIIAKTDSFFICVCMNLFGHSVEEDGSPLSDERQTIQLSLFALLKDFLKSPTPEELHSVLAYILTAREEQQVILQYLTAV